MKEIVQESIHDVRKRGKEYCITDGSKHYIENKVDPIEVMMAMEIAEDFFIGNILKYAIRFKVNRNLEDIKKISDYAHLLVGYLIKE